MDGMSIPFYHAFYVITDCRITYLSFEDVDPVTRSLSGYSGCSQRGVVVVRVLSTSSRDSISLLGVTVSYRAATHAAGAGCLALS